MIGYVTIGTNNLERAVAFYDELLGPSGVEVAPPSGVVAWLDARTAELP